MTEAEAIKKLEAEYPEEQRVWKSLLQDGMKATEILSWMEEYC